MNYTEADSSATYDSPAPNGNGSFRYTVDASTHLDLEHVGGFYATDRKSHPISLLEFRPGHTSFDPLTSRRLVGIVRFILLLLPVPRVVHYSLAEVGTLPQQVLLPNTVTIAVKLAVVLTL